MTDTIRLLKSLAEGGDLAAAQTLFKTARRNGDEVLTEYLHTVAMRYHQELSERANGWGDLTGVGRGMLLTDVGPHKIRCIKYIREANGMSLTDSKNLVDDVEIGIWRFFLRDVSTTQAMRLTRKAEVLGASVAWVRQDEQPTGTLPDLAPCAPRELL